MYKWIEGQVYRNYWDAWEKGKFSSIYLIESSQNFGEIYVLKCSGEASVS